jgi:ribosomal protein S18 acetylase RimI-like enzyme
MIDRHLSLSTINEYNQAMLVDLHSAQQRRLSRLDIRLNTALSRPHANVISWQEKHHEKPIYVVHNAQGQIRGSVQPALWLLQEQSTLLAFLTRRNGIAQQLILPAPDEHDALIVADMLLHALNDYWQHHATTGDLIRWPSCDTWLEPVLKKHGFLLDSVCAFRPLPPSPTFISSSFTIRPAQSADQETLLVLFQEELLAHRPYTPFVHLTSAVLQAFQAKLERFWQGTSLEDGAPLFLVMEQNDKIVAMAQCSLLTVRPDDEPGLTPPGLYGSIDNICVHSSMRGQGSGRLLVEAVYASFAATRLKLDGCVLWYNPDNPLARSFWSRAGFEPLWTTYQRLNS